MKTRKKELWIGSKRCKLNIHGRLEASGKERVEHFCKELERSLAAWNIRQRKVWERHDLNRSGNDCQDVALRSHGSVERETHWQRVACGEWKPLVRYKMLKMFLNNKDIDVYSPG